MVVEDDELGIVVQSASGVESEVRVYLLGFPVGERRDEVIGEDARSWEWGSLGACYWRLQPLLNHDVLTRCIDMGIK